MNAITRENKTGAAAYIRYELRQMDAYMYDGQWTENTSYLLADDLYMLETATHKELFKYMTGIWIQDNVPFETFHITEDANGLIEFCFADDNCPLFSLTPLEAVEPIRHH